MISLIAALLLAAAPTEADQPAAAAKPAAATPAKPANIENAVDANGVPAWAKRKRLHPVQNCSSRPNITVDTWRAEYEKDGKGRVRGVPIKTTCK